MQPIAAFRRLRARLPRTRFRGFLHVAQGRLRLPPAALKPRPDKQSSRRQHSRFPLRSQRSCQQPAKLTEKRAGLRRRLPRQQMPQTKASFSFRRVEKQARARAGSRSRTARWTATASRSLGASGRFSARFSPRPPPLSPAPPERQQPPPSAQPAPADEGRPLRPPSRSSAAGRLLSRPPPPRALAGRPQPPRRPRQDADGV